MIEAALEGSQRSSVRTVGMAAKLGLPPSTLESKIRSLKISKHCLKPISRQPTLAGRPTH